MKYLILAFLSLSLFACNEKTTHKVKIDLVQETPNLISSMTATQISKLDSININFQLRGNCYAYSSNKNAQESNGEAHSDNLPKTVDEKFPRKGLYLLINRHYYDLFTIVSFLLDSKIQSTDFRHNKPTVRIVKKK